MLTKFSVKNFKNFQYELDFDLKASNYEFNKDSIKDGIVKTAVIYGDNASGKSNLGLAIMDIMTHLTNHEKYLDEYFTHYLNLESTESKAEFTYHFVFNNTPVIYKYSKTSVDHLEYEELIIQDRTIIKYDKSKNIREVLLKSAEHLNFERIREDQSLVKLVYMNTIIAEDDSSSDEAIFSEFMGFVKSMLRFTSVYGNYYQGFKSGMKSIVDMILNADCLNSYKNFLSDMGIHYDLFVKKVDNQNMIYVRFDSGKEADLFKIMSSGTTSLSLFYAWYIYFSKESKFVLIDEFDSYFHHKVSKKIIELLKKANCQVVLTTHNTANMSNNILRPDSYYVISNGTVKTIAERAGREVREAQNIEKMYRAGSFDE